MLRLLIFIFLFPFFAFAQNYDPRIKQNAPAPGIKCVQIETVRFYTQKGNASLLESNTLTEKKYYSKEGRIDSAYHNYAFEKRFYFIYRNDSSWTCVSTIDFKPYDSTIVIGDSAKVFYTHEFSEGARHWYVGDSLHGRYYKKNGKRDRFFSYDRCSSAADSFWDYQSCGPFARRTLVHTGNIDTVCYFDARNRWMVKVINYSDSAGNPVKTEYINRSRKNFDIVPIHANHHIGDATLYLPENGSKVCMTVHRIYNAQGLPVKELWRPAKADFSTYVRTYAYTFW